MSLKGPLNELDCALQEGAQREEAAVCVNCVLTHLKPWAQEGAQKQK